MERRRTDVDVVARGPSVVVILLEGVSVVLVQQWREAVDTSTVELVQERLEPGESPLDAAVRGFERSAL